MSVNLYLYANGKIHIVQDLKVNMYLQAMSVNLYFQDLPMNLYLQDLPMGKYIVCGEAHKEGHVVQANCFETVIDRLDNNSEIIIKIISSEDHDDDDNVR